MAIVEAKEKVREHLITSFPGVPIAVENVPFTAPDDATYLRVQFMVQRPTDPTLGAHFHRENIELQVFVCSPLGVGSADAETLAEQVRDVFTKGITLVTGNIRMHVLSTPHVSSLVVTSDRLVVPVFVPITVEIYHS